MSLYPPLVPNALHCVNRISSQHMVFVASSQRSKGVTKVIQNLFAPSYRYKSLKGSRIPNKGGLKWKDAKRRGKLIDTQMGKYHIRNTIPPRACTEVKTIISWISSHEYIIVATQQPVGKSQWRIATEIDLLLWDCKKQTFVIVELKSGCGYREQHTGIPMQHGVIGTDSKRSQHELQCILMGMLWDTYFDNLPKELMLLYVNPKGDLLCIPETDFQISVQPQVIEDILTDRASAKTKTRRRRRRRSRKKKHKPLKRRKKR